MGGGGGGAVYLMQPAREESTSVGLVSCLLTINR